MRSKHWLPWRTSLFGLVAGATACAGEVTEPPALPATTLSASWEELNGTEMSSLNVSAYADWTASTARAQVGYHGRDYSWWTSTTTATLYKADGSVVSSQSTVNGHQGAELVLLRDAAWYGVSSVPNSYTCGRTARAVGVGRIELRVPHPITGDWVLQSSDDDTEISDNPRPACGLPTVLVGGEMKVGEVQTATATCSGYPATWSTDTPDNVHVNPSGQVTALAPGYGRVIVSCGDPPFTGEKDVFIRPAECEPSEEPNPEDEPQAQMQAMSLDYSTTDSDGCETPPDDGGGGGGGDGYEGGCQFCQQWIYYDCTSGDCLIWDEWECWEIPPENCENMSEGFDRPRPLVRLASTARSLLGSLLAGRTLTTETV